jgi:hypothetical protein
VQRLARGAAHLGLLTASPDGGVRLCVRHFTDSVPFMPVFSRSGGTESMKCANLVCLDHRKWYEVTQPSSSAVRNRRTLAAASRAQPGNVAGSVQGCDVAGSAQPGNVAGSVQGCDVAGSVQGCDVAGSAQPGNVAGSVQGCDVAGSVPELRRSCSLGLRATGRGKRHSRRKRTLPGRRMRYILLTASLEIYLV